MEKDILLEATVNKEEITFKCENPLYKAHILELRKNLKEYMSINELEKYLEQISEKSRKIIEVRWGLTGDYRVFNQYVYLNKLLGIKNSREMLKDAMMELNMRKYVNLLTDSEKYGWEDAANLSMIAVNYLPPELLVEKTIIGSEIESILKATLNECEYQVLRRRLCVYPDTLEILSRELNFCKGRIREIEMKAKEKLESVLTPIAISTIEIEQMRKNDEHNIDISIYELPLNLGGWNYYTLLEEYGIFYISELKNLTTEELLRKTSLNRIIASKIIRIAKEFDYQEYFKRVELANGLNLEDLKLSNRTFNALYRDNIRTVTRLLSLSSKDVMSIRNIGPKCCNEIALKREELGLPLK